VRDGRRCGHAPDVGTGVAGLDTRDYTRGACRACCFSENKKPELVEFSYALFPAIFCMYLYIQYNRSLNIKFLSFSSESRTPVVSFYTLRTTPTQGKPSSFLLLSLSFGHFQASRNSFRFAKRCVNTMPAATAVTVMMRKPKLKSSLSKSNVCDGLVRV